MRWLRKKGGYTMSEVIVVIAVMGILGAIAVPVYSGLRQASLESAAVLNARLINAARDAYALTIPDAYAAWNNAADDAARLEVLISQNLLAGSAPQYLSMNGQYTVDLAGGLRARTVLKHKGSTILY